MDAKSIIADSARESLGVLSSPICGMPTRLLETFAAGATNTHLAASSPPQPVPRIVTGERKGPNVPPPTESLTLWGPFFAHS